MKQLTILMNYLSDVLIDPACGTSSNQIIEAIKSEYRGCKDLQSITVESLAKELRLEEAHTILAEIAKVVRKKADKAFDDIC